MTEGEAADLSGGQRNYMTFQAPLYQPYRYAASNPPPLPVRAADDAGCPDYVVSAALLNHNSTGLTLSGATVSGKDVTIRIEMVAQGVAHVLLETDQTDPQRVRLARKPDQNDQQITLTMASPASQILLSSDFFQVRIDLDPFHIAFLTRDGSVLLEQNASLRDLTGRFMTLPFGFSEIDGKRAAYHDSFDVEPDEHFYGGGEKFTSFDKRGQRLEMWNYDACSVLTERAYKNVPFFISTKGYGLFVDSISPTVLDFAATCNAILSLVVPDSALDYYVIAGPHPKTIIQRYSSLVGFPTLPPKWAFGLWVSSGWQANGDDEARARKRAGLMREFQIPCDVMHLDSYWQRHGCWSDLVWDSKAFPDPEKLLQELKCLGYKISLWMDPRIGNQSERFLEGDQHGYFLKDGEGKTQVADSWDGFHPPVANLDFTNPEAVAWFQSLVRPLLRMGVDALKTDNGEKVPTNAIACNGMTGLELHNLYALLYNDAVADVIYNETGRTPLLWDRSTFAGGQRHSAQWGGDAGSTYQDMASTLRGGLSLAVCGHAFWSHDIGGFNGQPSPDLYLRWAQFGLFSPLARLHGMTTRLPWDYGEEVLAIFRDYVRLRYSLLPYLYTYAINAAETGLPILRPMWLEFPDDPNTFPLDLQYMLGSDILVAPVYNRSGKRPVYLPCGSWIDYWSHEIIGGPSTRWVESPLEKMPLYVRGNALIPTIEPPQYLVDEPFSAVTFNAFLLDQGSFTMRDMDGTVQLNALLKGSALVIHQDGIAKKIGLCLMSLPGTADVNSVLANGIELKFVEKLTPSDRSGWTREPDGTIRAVLP